VAPPSGSLPWSGETVHLKPLPGTAPPGEGLYWTLGLGGAFRTGGGVEPPKVESLVSLAVLFLTSGWRLLEDLVMVFLEPQPSLL